LEAAGLHHQANLLDMNSSINSAAFQVLKHSIWIPKGKFRVESSLNMTNIKFCSSKILERAAALDLSQVSEIGAFIDGEQTKCTSCMTFENRTPISGAILGKVMIPTEEQINAAVVSSQNAFNSWSQTPVRKRGEYLYNAALIMENDQMLEELCLWECIDAGIPISQVMDAHIGPAIDCLKYYASLAMSSADGISGTGRVVDTPDAGGGRESFCFTRREPLGVCVGIGAWNYPLSILMLKLAPALACGNTFIFKPSECTPITAIKLAHIFEKAGLPHGVFNVLPGDRSTGAILTKHDLVSKVSFTGSTQTGIKISQDAATTLKRVTMELGGKSPIIIFEDCDLDEGVSAAIMANFVNNGQVCTNGTR